MVLFVVAAVALLLLGALLGWAVRGRAATWCPVHGDALICATCRPSPATGRASVQMRQPHSSTVDGPLMTRGAENRTGNIRARRSI